MLHPGPGEVPAAAAALPPALPQVIETPPRWAPILWQKPLANTSRIQLQPKLYPLFPVSMTGRGGRCLKLSRDCALPESRRELTREICNASCCSGKVYLGPSGKPLLPQGQNSPSTGPNRGPGPCYSQTSVPSAELLATRRMNALRQGRKRKLPQLWGLLDWKLNRAAGNLKSGRPKH